MKSWMVWQDTSGLELGVYEGETGDDAILAMLSDANTTDAPDEGLRARALTEYELEIEMAKRVPPFADLPLAVKP